MTEDECRRRFRIARLPAMRKPAKWNDVYVTKKLPLVVYYKRAEKLVLDPGCTEMALHGLGVCCNTAIYVAQDLVARYGPVLNIRNILTRTEHVVDEHDNDVMSISRVIKNTVDCRSKRVEAEGYLECRYT